jgi:hypothetical protein
MAAVPIEVNRCRSQCLECEPLYPGLQATGRKQNAESGTARTNRHRRARISAKAHTNRHWAAVPPPRCAEAAVRISSLALRAYLKSLSIQARSASKGLRAACTPRVEHYWDGCHFSVCFAKVAPVPDFLRGLAALLGVCLKGILQHAIRMETRKECLASAAPPNFVR